MKIGNKKNRFLLAWRMHTKGCPGKFQDREVNGKNDQKLKMEAGGYSNRLRPFVIAFSPSPC